MYGFFGTVKTVGKLQTFADGGLRRDLIVEERGVHGRPNVVAFLLKNKNVNMLRRVMPGMRVKVGFCLSGRELTDPKSGELRYGVDLEAEGLVLSVGVGEDPDIAVGEQA